MSALDTSTQPIPADIQDAVLMALDGALAQAGFAPLSEQVIACDDLEAELLDALWNDDMTLQQAARAAVERHRRRLIGEVMIEWGA